MTAAPTRETPIPCCLLSNKWDPWQAVEESYQQYSTMIEPSRFKVANHRESPQSWFLHRHQMIWHPRLQKKRAGFQQKAWEAPASCPQSKQPSKLQTFGLSLPNLRDFRNIESNFGILQSQRNTSKYCIAMQGFGKRSSTPENWLLFYRWTRNDENEKETISWRAPCEKHQPESTMQTIFKQ